MHPKSVPGDRFSCSQGALSQSSWMSRCLLPFNLVHLKHPSGWTALINDRTLQGMPVVSMWHTIFHITGV